MKTPDQANSKARSSKAKKSQWPKIRTRQHRSGQVGYLVDLGSINGKRNRRSFKTKPEAEACAAQARVKRENEGLAGFKLSHTVTVAAAKAHAILVPVSFCSHLDKLNDIHLGFLLGIKICGYLKGLLEAICIINLRRLLTGTIQ